jgi:hypothetical protein
MRMWKEGAGFRAFAAVAGKAMVEIPDWCSREVLPVERPVPVPG